MRDGRQDRTGLTRPTANPRLRRARELRGWSQQRLAEAVGTNKVMVSRWEGGVMAPSPHFRAQLCELFGQTAAELGFIPLAPAGEAPEPRAAGVVSARPWQAPFQRSPYFTGREATLARLHAALDPTRLTAPTQALCGLGGVGKTQTALEYAHRYREQYEAVLWARAESRDLLLADIAAMASVLGVAPSEEGEQHRAMQAVTQWLQTHPGWLLVLDNVEDLGLLEQALPTAHFGRVLLTMRSPITGSGVQAITLDSMAQDDGAFFLLRRAKLLPPEAPFANAAEALQAASLAIASALGGLPLALDQAGAYIEETGCSLDDYLALYGTQRARLLDRRGKVGNAHPASVGATLALAIEQVEQSAPAATDLLRVCALLHPDAIPEELFGPGVAETGPIPGPVATDALALDEAVAILRGFALLRRDSTRKTFCMHRLVQVMLLDAMDEAERRLWAERAVRGMNTVFPDSVDDATWRTRQRLAPHARVCATHIATLPLVSPEAGSLLSKLGAYDVTQGQYAEAERLLSQAAAILLSTVGERHPDTATCLNDLAVLYRYQGRFSEAEPLYRRAFVIRQDLFDRQHPAILESLNNLGTLCVSQGRYAQAAALLQEARTLGETVWGASHRTVARPLHNLGWLYALQGQFDEAETLLQRALGIWRQELGETHLQTLATMSQLAIASGRQGKFAEAEALHQQVLAERERQVGPGHFEVAESLHYLAYLAQEQGHYARAESLYQRALAIRQQTLGSRHPCTLRTRHHLARLALACGQHEQAAALGEEVLRLREETLGADHPEVAESLHLLSEIYHQQGNSSAAESLRRRVQTIRRQEATSPSAVVRTGNMGASVPEQILDGQATAD